jgi:hypothetical protein
MQYYLAEDIYSTFKKGHIYGIKGEIVTQIADAVACVIVENIKGDRYSVNKSKLILKNDKN